ncbi:MAG: hemerythrin domain-containing protein, partial [Acidobacteriia bacterium]|nr:hemerythrin domain-containing protein [Terriglobia bacterium]
MAGFSQHFASIRNRVERLAMLAEPARSVEEICRSAEARGGLELEDVALLLAWGRDPVRREYIHAASRHLRDTIGPRTVDIIIPEYLTSFCQNDCLYCGYRQSNALAERVRLRPDHYERELDLILSWGYRQIELVLADDPDFPADQVAQYVSLTGRKLAERGGGLVALNAPPYEEADYRRLRSAGLDWVALWQETYDQPHFERWHLEGSPKRQYEFRLDVWDRAIAAGFTRVGLGVLFGLYDWRFDVLALVEHANYLQRTYGIAPHVIGIPRLKPARGVLASQKPSHFSVSDEDYRLAVSVYHLAVPQARLFFNTREPYEFNLSMVTRGDLFTVDCETLPGAYLRGRLPGQFATHSYPSRREVTAEFTRQGYAWRFLEREDAAPPAGLPAASGEGFTLQRLERCACEHREIRAKLDEWESFLETLHTTSAHLRWVVAGRLRERLRFFDTDYMEHCREEENLLRAALVGNPEGEKRLDALRSEHEHFAIDLDRFQRQITSYEQSGNPTALLMLGGRMVSELREHLDAEDRWFAHWLERGSAPPLPVD